MNESYVLLLYDYSNHKKQGNGIQIQFINSIHSALKHLYATSLLFYSTIKVSPNSEFCFLKDTRQIPHRPNLLQARHLATSNMDLAPAGLSELY
jgi:hypothetical protein